MRERVAVVGGGIAGLTAALYAAQGGAEVTLLERASTLGGRASTRHEGAYRFNMGPHALYRGGEAGRVLKELGISVDGAVPPLAGAGARRGGRVHALPAGFVSLVTTGLLRPAEKIEAGRWLAGLSSIDVGTLNGRSLADYLSAHVTHRRVREVIEALVRLSTYANAPDAIGAGAAIGQLQLAFDEGVTYLHGGWGEMVESLRARALRAGVDVRPGLPVRSITRGVEGYTLAFRQGDVAPVVAGAVVLAVPPADIARMLEGQADAVVRFAAEIAALVPARAASLELGLTQLPRPKNGFVLGIDEPTYFSVHSATARLAPEGAALLHCTRYLAPDEVPDRDVLNRSLGAILEQAQPGWREYVEHETLLTDVVVSHGIPPAGGLAARPGVDALGAGLFLAGDWVGDEGQLADASFASGKVAGGAAAAVARERSAA